MKVSALDCTIRCLSGSLFLMMGIRDKPFGKFSVIKRPI